MKHTRDLYELLAEAIGVTDEDMAKALIVRRMIPLRGKIDGDLAGGINKVMISLDFKEVAPITLLIGSDGGDVVEANHIIGVMDSLRSEVNGLVVTDAGSMAVDILLSCKKRSALPNAQFFVHYCRSGFQVIHDSGNISDGDMEVLKQRLISDRRGCYDLYTRKLNKSVEQVNELFRRGEKYNIHYTAAEAKEIGFIEKIETDFKFFGTIPEKK